MLLVDSTVWIDFFRGRETPQVIFLTESLEKDEDMCICGPILTEVLQGIADEHQYRKTREFFSPLVFLPLTEDHFLSAADIFRKARMSGESIRKTIDCIIASCAILQHIPLLHNDNDFLIIERFSRLKTVKFP